MKELDQVLWVDTFLLAQLIIVGVFGLILLSMRNRVACGLGLVFLSYIPSVLPFWFTGIFGPEVVILLPVAAIYLYIERFFSRSTGTEKFLFIPVLAIPLLLYFEGTLSSIVAGLIILVLFYHVVKILQKESRSRGFSWFQLSGGSLKWLRNFLVLNIFFIGWYYFGWGFQPIYLSLFLLLLFTITIYQIAGDSDFLQPFTTTVKYQKSTLSPVIKSSIYQKVRSAFEEEEYFKNDRASLSDLAHKVGASTHHLSQVLNDNMMTSFQDLLTTYRVRKACVLLRQEQNANLKIENIANEVGYNSKSAFNTAFKKKTGKTPSQFRDEKGVLIYRDEHLPGVADTLNDKYLVNSNHDFTKNTVMGMISNFYKILIRNAKRNLVFTILNITGLTIGFTCAIFIYLYIQDERSYDSNIEDHDRIYRIVWMNDNPQTRTPHPLSFEMKSEWPEIEQAVSFSPWYGPGLSTELIRIKNPEKQVIFEEPGFYFADSTFLDLFSIKVLEGDRNALHKPFTLVITKRMADKYFGADQSAVGKVLEVNDMPLEVSTVVEGFAKNTHFHFNAIIPYQTLREINPNDTWMTWSDFGHFNYVKVREGTDVDKLQGRIAKLVLKNIAASQSDRQRLLSGEDYFDFQPIRDIHLTSHLRWELENNGKVLYTYILTATILFILIIVAINYVNLTTSRAVERSKEIGIRKTFGAFKTQIKVQFYIESVLFSIFATVIAVLLTLILLPDFNELAGKDFSPQDLISEGFVWKLLLISVLMGLLAGLYPAAILSAFEPATVLKGKFASSTKGLKIRRALVVVQFTVSAILISGSLIILRQIDYMNKKELGFDKEAVISIDIPSSVETGGPDFVILNRVKNKLSNVRNVDHVSMISNIPGDQFNQHRVYHSNNPENMVDVSEVMVDFGFEKALGIKLEEGRSFDPSFSSDSSGRVFMINEIMAKKLQLDQPVGERVTWVGDNVELEGTIIGVVQDFHFQSMHSAIQPLMMIAQPQGAGAGHLLLRTDGQNLASTLLQVEEIYKELNSELPFEFHFLDQQMSNLYNQEKKTLKVFSIFSGLALFLACLGLLGMAIATMNQRVKEIGVKKILGASSFLIISSILKEFGVLIFIALLIGLPLSYIFMNSWLAEFYYHAPFSIMPFLFSSFLLLAISVISIISSILKISRMNPVDALRDE